MKRFDYGTRLLVVLGCVGLAGAGFVLAQRPASGRPVMRKKSPVEVKIRRLKGLGRDNLVRTPEYKSDVHRGVKKAREWVEVRTEYDTDGEDWADELAFAYYVMCRTKEANENVYNLYRRVVRYVDVERGKKHYSCVYLRPSTVERYGEPVAVAVVVSFDGEVVAQESEASISLPDEWWDSPAVLESDRVKVTVRDGQLLTRSESPWALLNIDDHEWIKRD